MAERKSSKSSNKRSKKRQPSISSDEDLFMEEPNDPIETVESTESADKPKEDTGNLSAMTEEEMTQHLKLCMKLSVENKINMKNAFGLRLIDIMQKIVKKNEKADIQQASLSLQASAKIYAGRVEALYQDTFRFHGHLQSIVSGGKKEKKGKNAEDEMDDMDDDGSDRGKTKPQRNKCKSYLKPEESLSIEQDVSTLSAGEPHGNFVTINSAFSTSRLAPKLLSILQLVNDSCKQRCAFPEPCFKPITPISNETFGIPQKLEGIITKIKNFDVSQAHLQALLDSNEASHAHSMSAHKSASPLPIYFNQGDDRSGDDSIFEAPCNDSEMAGPSKNRDSIESTVDKFDVLNITVDTFVNDISAAVTHQGFDERLLPPNSALKKVIDSTRKSSIKPSVGRSTKKKVREPFFAGKSAGDVKHLFVKGRANAVSQKILSEWSVEDTSNIDFCYEFVEEYENKIDQEPDYKTTLEDVLEVIKQYDLQYHFKFYFNKQSQMWKFSRRKLSLNESFGGAHLHNETERRLGSLGGALNDPENLAVSFQNLSINDSIREDPLDAEENPSNHELPGVPEIEDQQFSDSPEIFGNIDELMVKPPELVRPVSMKYDKRPMNLNTEKIKDLLWKIISRHLEVNNTSDEIAERFVLFSKVYEELKLKLEKEVSEFISMQFAFVVLLILANQKTLLITNVKENTDLSIQQDICEIGVTENM